MTAAEALPVNEAGLFLEQLYGGYEAGWLTLFAVNRTTGDKVIRWRPVTDVDGLVADAATLQPECCVWFGAATRAQRTSGRGGAVDCEAIPGLWLDIDVAGPNHAQTDLPPTIDAAEQLIAAFPVPPTVVVNTGGGLQAWWLFNEPVAAVDATPLLARWGATWAERGRERGWHVDNVFDLARVMRLPGTTNRKTAPRPVYIVRADWRLRFGLDDLDQWLIDPPQAQPPSGARAVPYIGPERPGDAYNAKMSGHDLLLETGWIYDDVQAGNYHYRAPHHANDKGVTGATFYPDDGHITIWSETFARDHNLKPKRPYDPFGYFAAYYHGNDFRAATEALAAQGYGTPTITGGVPVIAAHTSAPSADDPWADPIPLGDSVTVPEFPIEVLPIWMADHVRAVAQELQVAVDLPAVLGMSTLACAVAGHVVVHVKNTWYEPLNIFLCVALPPGAGKSPAVRAMTRPLDIAERDGRKAAEIRRKQVEMERRIVETKLKKAEAAGDAHQASGYLAELETEALQVPVVPRFIADDATPEALCTLLHEQHGRLALISTEGGPFEMMTGRYSERANLEVYLQAWSGDTIRIDRVARGSMVINDPVLNVCLTVQPAVIAALAERPELAGRGLTARFMYSMPRDFVGHRNLVDDADIDPGIASRYEAHMARLICVGRPSVPRVIGMATEARRIFLLWRQGLEEQRTPEGSLRPLAEWSTKLESSVLRTAGLLAVADGADTIDPATMTRAITVGEYWIEHARAVHDMWGADEMIAKARQVLTWARQRQLQQFTLRDVYGSLRRMFPTAADAVPVLNLLTERGWLRPLFDGPITTGARGKPSPEFALHPSALWITEAHARDARGGVSFPQSHARDARHVSRDKTEELTHSLQEETKTRHRAHDAHDAHEPDPAPPGHLDLI